MIFDDDFISKIESILNDITEHTDFTFIRDNFFNCFYDIKKGKNIIGSFRFSPLSYYIDSDDLEKYSCCSCPIKLDSNSNFNDYDSFKNDLINCFHIKYTITTIFDFLT